MEQKENKVQKTFKISENIDILKNMVESKNFFYAIDDYNNKIKENNNFQFHIDKNIVKHALIKILNMWNHDEKSRGFLKHLISAYKSISTLNKIIVFSDDTINDKKNVCAIMGFKLTGLRNIAQNFSSLIIEKAKLELAKTEEDKKIAFEELQSKINNFPQEVRLKRFAWYSNDSNKYLSNEAKIALIDYFYTNMLLLNEKELLYLGNNFKRQKHKTKNNYKKQAPKEKNLNTNTFGDILSQQSLDNLNKVKNGNK